MSELDVVARHQQPILHTHIYIYIPRGDQRLLINFTLRLQLQTHLLSTIKMHFATFLSVIAILATTSAAPVAVAE
jgi:hypothetical protein